MAPTVAPVVAAPVVVAVAAAAAPVPAAVVEALAAPVVAAAVVASNNTLRHTLIRSDLTRPECPSGRRTCNACSSGIEGRCTTSGVVYCIACNLCSTDELVQYIGECKRPVRLRFNDHVLNAKNASRETPLGFL